MNDRPVAMPHEQSNRTAPEPAWHEPWPRQVAVDVEEEHDADSTAQQYFAYALDGWLPPRPKSSWWGRLKGRVRQLFR